MRVTARSLTSSALLDALSVILPAPEQTWLLRACLYSGEPGRHAWQVYQNQAGDLRKVLRGGRQGIKTLAPLLLNALQRNSCVTHNALLTHLRTAYLREELRSTIFRRILRNVLSELTAAGVSHIVLKGAALADAVYPDPVLRHCHDIDILLDEVGLSRAIGLFPPLGFAPLSKEFNPGVQHITLTHESGLPLELHRHFFRVPYYSVPSEDLWARSQPQSIAGVPTRVLSPADNLVHVCVQAFCNRSPESLRWVPDAWYILRGYPNLDWNIASECAVANHLSLPLSVTLGYLSEQLHAPIPPTILDRLRTAASQTDALRGETALAAAVTGAGVSFKRLVRMRGGWPARALVVKWMLFPSASYVRAAYHVRHSWLLSLYYVYRPMRYAARRIRLRWNAHTERKLLLKDLKSPAAHPAVRRPYSKEPLA